MKLDDAPEPPLTTPERGVTMQAPIFMADAKAEGWRV